MTERNKRELVRATRALCWLLAGGLLGVGLVGIFLHWRNEFSAAPAFLGAAALVICFAFVRNVKGE